MKNMLKYVKNKLEYWEDAPSVSVGRNISFVSFKRLVLKNEVFNSWFIIYINSPRLCSPLVYHSTLIKLLVSGSRRFEGVFFHRRNYLQ